MSLLYIPIVTTILLYLFALHSLFYNHFHTLLNKKIIYFHKFRRGVLFSVKHNEIFCINMSSHLLNTAKDKTLLVYSVHT